VSAALGWTAHDAAVYLGGQDRTTFLELLPESLLLAAALGLVLALLAGRPRALILWVLLLLVASLLPSVVRLPLARAEVWLPRALLLLTGAAVAAGLLATRLGRGAVRCALVAGFAVCALTTLYRLDLRFVPTAAALAALGSLALGFVGRAGPRRVGTLLVFVLPFFVVPLRGILPRRELRPDLTPPEVVAAPGTPNLVLVVLDTVRADRMSAYGYERETTPGLARFAREHATRYTNVHSTTSWTLPSHASLFTGLRSAEHGADHPRGGSPDDAVQLAMRPANALPAEVVTLAERLRADGFRTGAILANCAYLNRRFGLDQGYEHYDDRTATYVQRYAALAQMTGRHAGVGHDVSRDAEEITDTALAWLDRLEGDAPFFLTVNYMDAHEPYLPGGPADDAFSDVQPVDPAEPLHSLWPLLYDRALVRLDVGVTRLLDTLEARGHFEDTVVVVTSDHGQALGEHDYYGHAWTLYEEVTRVPLLVKPLGEREALVVDEPFDNVSTHDLMLELIGKPLAEGDPPRVGPTGWMGEWYAGKQNPMVQAWSERVGRDLEVDLVAWLDGDRKVIVDSGGGVVAYDLATDPGEEHPLVLGEEELAAARQRAEVWWRAHPPRDLGEAPAELDEDLQRQMEALGY
jgi:arylsulfatase A-like enzyme